LRSSARLPKERACAGRAKSASGKSGPTWVGGAAISTSVYDLEAARRGPRSEEGIVETRATIPVCSARGVFRVELITQPASTASKQRVWLGKVEVERGEADHRLGGLVARRGSVSGCTSTPGRISGWRSLAATLLQELVRCGELPQGTRDVEPEANVLGWAIMLV